LDDFTSSGLCFGIECRLQREIQAALIDVEAAKEQYARDVRSQVRYMACSIGPSAGILLMPVMPFAVAGQLLVEKATFSVMRTCPWTSSPARLRPVGFEPDLAAALSPQGRLAAEAEAHGRNVADLERFARHVCAQAGASLAPGGAPLPPLPPLPLPQLLPACLACCNVSVGCCVPAPLSPSV
jgi:hypothetical protein